MAKSLKSIVILDQVSGYAQIDIIHALSLEYDKCVLIAGEIKERNKAFPAEARWEKIIEYQRNSFFQRILTWGVASLQMFFKVLFRYRKSKIIAFSNPPFSVFIPWLLKCEYDVVIYDIYPDVLVHMGYVNEDNWLVKIWAKLNKRAFDSAARVITLSDGMKEVLSSYTSPEKIEVIPNWSFNSNLPTVEKTDNIILKKLEVSDKFIISYSGNFGVTHPLEALVELAAQLAPEKFHVILAGDGARKPIIERALEKWQPVNFSLLPWQPADQLHHVLSMGNLGVVTLDDTAANISVPSKTYDLLSAGTPILGLCSPSSALSLLINKHECGQSFSFKEIDALIDFINKCATDDEFLMNLSQNALIASKEYTSDNAMLYA